LDKQQSRRGKSKTRDKVIPTLPHKVQELLSEQGGGVEGLLSSLRAAGFKARADGARLLVSPADRLTPELTAAIGDHKAGLLDLLREEAADPFAGLVPWGEGPWGGLPHPARPEYQAQLLPAAEYHAGWAALEAHNAAVRARTGEAAKQAALRERAARRRRGADGCVLPGMNGEPSPPPEARPVPGDAS
jgi:hypothetical protein